MGSTTRRYDEAFKREAVRLVKESSKSPCTVAKELGISDHSLYNWIKQCEPEGKLTDEGKTILNLKKELADVAMERDILKKAVAIFSKASK